MSQFDEDGTEYPPDGADRQDAVLDGVVDRLMSQFDEDGTEYPPDDRQDAVLDSEVDFDDEADDDQLPLDEVEATELGANLDDQERFPDD